MNKDKDKYTQQYLLTFLNTCMEYCWKEDRVRFVGYMKERGYSETEVQELTEQAWRQEGVQ